MKSQTQKQAGIAVILGSLLMILTMALHPVGGNFEHLVKVANMAIIAHSIAIFSIPTTLIGFWGLSQRLAAQPLLSRAGLIFGGISLMAALMAAAINGLALPFFVRRFENASPEELEMVRVALNYGMSLNHAMDYIFIGGICMAILIWSIAIWKTRTLPLAIALLGGVIGIGFLVTLASGFVLVDVHGFRIFVFGVAFWILSTGILMLKPKP